MKLDFITKYFKKETEVGMKGYKAFNSKLQCNDFQFKVGKTFTHKDNIKPCSSGFHFCVTFQDVYGYYPKQADTRICEVEAIGETITDGDKTVTDKLKIIRELSSKEILDLVFKNFNSGYGNSGDWNSGYGNSGDWNSGNRNSGDWNSGDWNSGDWNSGNRNSGNRNSGNWNSGDWNSGYGNSGNRNSGDWNSGDGNSGYFNTEIPVYFFNKPSKMKYSPELENKLRSINVKPVLTWIYTGNMTEKEKNDNPKHKVTGGFLRSTGRHDWTKITEKDKELIRSLPNFDDKIFKKISNGVSAKKSKK